MTITLGSVTLNSHVSWRGRFNQSNVPGSEEVTLGGRTAVTRLAGASNPDIILEAIEEDNIRKGYFTQAQLEDLGDYRDSGITIVLNYHGTMISVVIPIDGINVEKSLWKSQYTSDEKYIGTITCKRV